MSTNKATATAATVSVAEFEALKAQLAILAEANASLREKVAAKQPKISWKISDATGVICFYGFGRRPICFYLSQLRRFFAVLPGLMKEIETPETIAEIKAKGGLREE